MIGAASTGIVHDIENPLSGILGFTRLLEVGLDDADKIDYCLGIKKGVSRIRKMIAEILAIASGREDIPLEIGEVNLEKFFSDIVTQMPLNGDVALNLDYEGVYRNRQSQVPSGYSNVIKNANEALQDIEHGRTEIACNA